MYYCDMVWHIYSTKRGTAMHAKIKCAALMLLLFSPALLSPLLQISEGIDKKEGQVHHEIVSSRWRGQAGSASVVVQWLIHVGLFIS